MKRSGWVSYLPPLLLAAVSIGAFFGDVLTYGGHNDSGLSVYVSIFVVLLCLLPLLKAVRRRRKVLASMYAGVIAVSLFLAYWENRIPFCTLCDGTTAEELGWFLSYWIPLGA